MVDKISSWKFSEDFAQESEVILRARARAAELGIESITPSVGAQLALLVSIAQAKSVVEVGTGAGVSGLWLLSGNDHVVLASIESDIDAHNIAKVAFSEANVPASRLRLINGKSLDVMANLADAAYDLVLLDADLATLPEQIHEASRVLRPGGVIAISHAMWRDRVPDPAMRDDNTSVYRDVLRRFSESSDFVVSLLPIGDGLLLASRRG
jgi:predicted O-methyltransferase YrrM